MPPRRSRTGTTTRPRPRQRRRLFRANASVGSISYGDVVEIDPDSDEWAPLIQRGFLAEVDGVDLPADDDTSDAGEGSEAS